MTEPVTFNEIGEIGLFLATAFLWWDTRRLANDAKTSSEANLKESKRQSDAAVSAAASAEAANETAKQIHASEKLLSQRQMIVPLWTYITSIEEIDRESIIEPTVLKTMNALELIALCCEGGMIDQAVIKATFSEIYIRQYEAIDSLPTMPGMKKDGKQLLRENRAARRFYEELKKEDTEHGRLKTN